VPLDPRSVVHYLLERDALEPEDVLDRGLSVTEVPRRNANFAIRRRGAPGLFVKQSRAEDAFQASSLHVEGTLATVAAEDPAFAAVAELSPALRLYDPCRRVLVLELVDGEDLASVAAREGGVPPPLARDLGTAVGTLHRDVPRDAEGGPGPQQAWILSLPQMTDEQLPGPHAAVHELRRVAREDASLAEGLRTLQEGWRSDAFIHGDLKWENVLASLEGDERRIHLVDWELGGWGDAAWDVGGLLHAYLRAWVIAMPADALAAGSPPVDVRDLERMAPSIAALWAGYRDAAAPAEPRDFLLRSVRFAGARLLQTAFEHVAEAPALTGHTVGLAQLAANVVARPEQACRTLFGLQIDAAA
jgi:phosphotransferase family enzyme